MVSADGAGVVSHAGTVLLSDAADRFGLTAAFSEATDGLRRRRSGHDPGRVLVDVAVAIADGAETISDVHATGPGHSPGPGIHLAPAHPATNLTRTPPTPKGTPETPATAPEPNPAAGQYRRRQPTIHPHHRRYSALLKDRG